MEISSRTSKFWPGFEKGFKSRMYVPALYQTCQKRMGKAQHRLIIQTMQIIARARFLVRFLRYCSGFRIDQ